VKWKLAEWLFIVILGVSYIGAFFLTHGMAIRIKVLTRAPYRDCMIASNQYWFMRFLGGDISHGN
jgi:hypothetical protein